MDNPNGMSQNNQGMAGKKCGCPHHKMVPIFIALIGLTFLLNAVWVLSDQAAAVIWPILLILIGLQKIFGGMCQCCSR
jgi:hypothetical protein